MSEECIFCKIVNGKIESKIIYENERFFSIFDIKPLVEGHALVVSKNHFETTLDIPDNLGPEFLDCIKKTALKVMEKFDAEGFNLHNNNKKVAGQLVNHFHMHILPRKKGDEFKPCV